MEMWSWRDRLVRCSLVDGGFAFEFYVVRCWYTPNAVRCQLLLPIPVLCCVLSNGLAGRFHEGFNRNGYIQSSASRYWKATYTRYNVQCLTLKLAEEEYVRWLRLERYQ